MSAACGMYTIVDNLDDPKVWSSFLPVCFPGEVKCH